MAEKTKITDKLLAIFAVVAIGIGVLVVAVIAFIFYSFNQSEHEQQKAADNNEKILSSLTILNDQKTIAKGETSGDALTGSPESASAVAEFKVNRTLADLSNEISQNLFKAGYVTRERTPEQGSDIYIYHVVQSFTKGKYEVVADYSLLKGYKCPVEFFCSYSWDSPPNQRGFDTNLLNNEQVNKLTVTYQYDY